MSMTVIVTRNVSARVRGFLASVSLEMAPGVYTAPRLSPPARERIWEVLTDWFPRETEASIVLIWNDRQAVGGLGVRTLGVPPVSITEVDHLLLARRPARENAL